MRLTVPKKFVCLDMVEGCPDDMKGLIGDGEVGGEGGYNECSRVGTRVRVVKVSGNLFALPVSPP